MKKIKRILICAVLITVCFLLETTVFQKLAFALDYSESPDYRDVLIWIYEGTKRRNDHRLFLWTLKDILGGNLLGFYALIYMLIGYGNGFFQRVFYDEDIKLPLALIAGSEFLYGMVIYVLLFMLKVISIFELSETCDHAGTGFTRFWLHFVLYQIILHINRRLEEEEKGVLADLFDLLDRLKRWFIDLVKSRVFVLMLVFIVLSTILIQRVFVLQIVNGRAYLDDYKLQIQKTKEVQGTRGRILDRNGVVLADNKLAYSVTIRRQR